MRRFWVVVVSVVVLGGCSSGQPGANTAPSTLQVHVGVFGGPLRPNGEMAASNAPQTGATITVTDPAGRQTQAITDRDGIATFSVQPGKYTVDAPCDFKAHHVTVRAGRVARVQIHCDVP